MSDSTRYDEYLTQIMVNEKSIIGFLSTIFNFLARRTDFYYVPQGPYENMGFPPGVAEELVVKVLRKCDPKNWKPPNGANKPSDFNNEIMCSTVAQEVEVIADEDIHEETAEENSANNNEEISAEIAENNEEIIVELEANSEETNNPNLSELTLEENLNAEVNLGSKEAKSMVTPATNSPGPSISVDEPPPVIPTQKNSETYNGAEFDNYCWAQTITELDITVKLPPNIKCAKDLKVTINPGDICVACRTGDVLIKDTLPYKIKSIESIWSISEGKLLIHLEKIQERWWNKFLNSEDPIDLSKIDCSRPLYELPDDHIAKVRELQWNQEQKMKGLPTSDHIRNIDILKKAWNAEGSPFKGQEFDPNVLSFK